MHRMMRALALAVTFSGANVGAAQLDADTAAEAADAAWAMYADRIVDDTAAEMAAGEIEAAGASLRFLALSFEDGIGEPCEAPCAASDERLRPLFISLHGGGATSAEANDEQWQNQFQLGIEYAPAEGIYVAPRAPTDEWDCWHGPAVDALLTRLIGAFVAAGSVDPDRVYLMGYSAGGDGVYQLATRMTDRFAAAAMMAGHPNGVSMENLRNLPFALHVGEDDSDYDRAAVAAAYGRKLQALHRDDPDGYAHQVQVHPGKGHWMDLEDRVAVAWMEGHVRDVWPARVVWRLGGRQPSSFYWLGLPEGGVEGDLYVGTVDGQELTLAGPGGRVVEVRLSRMLVDLEQPLTILSASGETLFEGEVERSEATILESIEARGDPSAVVEAVVTVVLP